MYCSVCGQQMTIAIPAGDHCSRPLCGHCGHVHYENPKILVACIATVRDKVLWIRRNTEPKRDHWAIPSGFVELGESPEEAACRELFEETRAYMPASALNLFVVGSIPAINQIYLVYHGELPEPKFEPTAEASAVMLYDAKEAPWQQYAYPEVAEAMRQFYADHAAGKYGVYRGHFDNGLNTFTQIPSRRNRA